MEAPFLAVQPGRKYRTIMCDPPWPVDIKANTKTQGIEYPVMPIAEIAALPIRSIAAPDCRLFLWTTNSMLPEALACIRAWRFRYRMTYTWVKAYGMGRSPVSASEFCIIATIGQPPTPLAKGNFLLNWKECGRQKRHSQKPDAIIHDFETFSPSPRIELFARTRRDGWNAWGNEI